MIPTHRKREQVLEAVKMKGVSPFLAADIANDVGVPIRSVSVMLRWLRHTGYVAHQGYAERTYRQPCKGYRPRKDNVLVYVWTGKSDPITRIRTADWERRKYSEPCS